MQAWHRLQRVKQSTANGSSIIVLYQRGYETMQWQQLEHTRAEHPVDCVSVSNACVHAKMFMIHGNKGKLKCRRNTKKKKSSSGSLMMKTLYSYILVLETFCSLYVHQKTHTSMQDSIISDKCVSAIIIVYVNPSF